MNAKTWMGFVLQQMAAESYLDQISDVAGGLESVLAFGNNNPRQLPAGTQPNAPNLPGKTRGRER